MLGSDNRMFERNSGFISEEEQKAVNGSVVAIAGAGGDGGELAVTLSRMGVGTIRLADPDTFEEENINRQACCTTETIGMNKAEAVASYISSINPRVNVSTFTDGITKSNAESFVEGADLLIDESEFSLHAIGVMLARAARKEGVPNLMALNIGFGATVTTFHPKGRTLERVLGLREDASIEEIEKTEVPIRRWAPYIPPYADLQAFQTVAEGKKSMPSIAPGVDIAAGLAATQALLNLVQNVDNRRPKPIYAPHVRMYDGMTGESKLIRYQELSHYRYLGRMILRNIFRKNPEVNY